MLYILFVSAAETWQWDTIAFGREQNSNVVENKKPSTHGNDPRPDLNYGQSVNRAALRLIALPQLVVAILALFCFNVQIINRISSGYPLWYVWIASQLGDDPYTHTKPSGRTEQTAKWATGRRSQIIVRGVIMYSAIHAGLFSSFLPPA